MKSEVYSSHFDILKIMLLNFGAYFPYFGKFHAYFSPNRHFFQKISLLCEFMCEFGAILKLCGDVRISVVKSK